MANMPGSSLIRAVTSRKIEWHKATQSCSIKELIITSLTLLTRVMDESRKPLVMVM